MICRMDETAREYALALDEADPLAGFAAEFVPAPGVLYLDGNSLGRLPRSTADRVAEVVAEEWGGGLVRSWSGWISLARRTGDLIGTSLLGARPGEVVVADSTSVNLYKLAWAAVSARPGRSVVLSTGDEFPTDRYVLQGLCAARDLTLRDLPADIDFGVVVAGETASQELQVPQGHLDDPAGAFGFAGGRASFTPQTAGSFEAVVTVPVPSFCPRHTVALRDRLDPVPRRQPGGSAP